MGRCSVKLYGKNAPCTSDVSMNRIVIVFDCLAILTMLKHKSERTNAVFFICISRDVNV